MPPLTPHPFPGRTSPLFFITLLLAMGLRASETEEDENPRSMVKLLMIAATVLMTENNTARRAAVVGGVMRLYRSTGTNALGFLLQAFSLGFAVWQSEKAASLAETLHKALSKKS